ncbi:MAG TPA: hypothetical protein VE573_00360 [Nitrososphaeraceae archaeon]|nr:hypothetical protein [Nitrososphaeraceae archaeon]
MDTSHWELGSDAYRDIGMIINMERGSTRILYDYIVGYVKNFMVILTKFGMILAVAAVTSIAAISVPTIVSAQNMTGNMASGQNTTADIDQTGSISSRSGGDILPRH